MGTEGSEMQGLAEARRMTLDVQLARTARKAPEALAYVYGEQRVTFGELDERVTRLANALATRGVGHGDRLAVLMTNRIEVVESYLAGSRLGAIVVPVNFRLVAAEITYILDHSGSVALVVNDELAELATTARAGAPALATVLQVGPGPLEPGAEAYEDALAAASPDPTPIDGSDDDPAFIMYTSGTTGRPKGAVLSHHNLTMNTFNMIIENRIGTGDEVWLSGLPLFHIGGLNGILPYLMVGGTVVMLPTGNFDPAVVVDLMELERVTGCYLVPTQWQQVCSLPGLRDRDLVLRRISWGASMAPPSTLQAMADAFPGVPNSNAFGQTEMSSVTCNLPGHLAVEKMGSVGKPVVNVEARIVDDDMRDVPRGETGEIVYRGPTVLQGYWNNPEADAEAFRGGWFHSGDLCRMDEDGFIYVVDRKKDMIISGGENIYSAEVEAVLDRHPKVAEVAVIGVPHERWVETPLAVVVPVDPADPPTEEELVAHCREHLASYKKPGAVAIVDHLPRNATGKVLKTELRTTYRGEGS
jgi:acyl-CoA synthetase (AMP-forming)/AMP-acid ligase II